MTKKIESGSPERAVEALGRIRFEVIHVLAGGSSQGAVGEISRIHDAWLEGAPWERRLVDIVAGIERLDGCWCLTPWLVKDGHVEGCWAMEGVGQASSKSEDG